MGERGGFWDRWQEVEIDDLLNGMQRTEFLLRYTISNPDLDTTIVGTRDVGHLQANLDAAVRGPLSADLVAEAKRRLAEAGSRPQPVAR